MNEAKIDLLLDPHTPKLCRRCGECKPYSGFYKDKTQPDGLQKYCVSCRRDMKGITRRIALNMENQAAMEADKAKIARREARQKAIWEAIRAPIDDAWCERHREWQNEKRRESQSARYKVNPEIFKAKNRRWIARHPEKAKEWAMKWAKNNPQKIRDKRARYLKGKADCALFKLAKRIRGTTRSAFIRKKLRKNNLTIEMVGCTWDFLKAHIEKQFTKGMGWHNMKDWHIDHLVPLSSAMDEAELIRLAHFSNLRPMWAAENMAKGDKIITCQPELTLKMV